MSRIVIVLVALYAVAILKALIAAFDEKEK